MAKICSICHQKINGINNIANVVENSVICSRCYEKLEGFRVTKKYDSTEELEVARGKYTQLAKELNFPESFIHDLQLHFDNKKKIIIGKDAIDDYLMTTSSILEGYTIQEYLGVVTGHMVIGTGVFSSFDATIADWTGGEAGMYTDQLDVAEKVAKRRAIHKSLALGGNALIAVDVEYTTFFKDLMGVIVSGTSVKVIKNEVKE